MRSFLLIALFAFSAVVGVVGQCTYDPSPARDFANGRVIKYDTSDKNPGGAHGAGGRSLKGGFCIDAKDNAQKCQGQAAEVVGLYECSNGQLVRRGHQDSQRRQIKMCPVHLSHTRSYPCLILSCLGCLLFS